MQKQIHFTEFAEFAGAEFASAKGSITFRKIPMLLIPY